MQKRLTDADVSDCVAEFFENAMDLTVRYLSDRADLSASAAFVMNRVCREGPIRLTTLATKEGVSQPSMTQLVQRLERLGLVTRLADPDDGRAALIGITAEGQRLIEHRKQLRRDRLATLLATLSAEDECTLRLAAKVSYPILGRLVANADAATNDDATPTDSGSAITSGRG